jgi:uncharacterized membrane protein YGL010W
MKTLDLWLQEYSVSHQNRTNQMIHKICVPLIFFSLLGMLWDLQLGGIRMAWLAAAFAMVFYVRLGLKVTALMGFQILVSFAILQAWSQNQDGLFMSNLVIFILAWIGQFIGHKVEGMRPSFYKDLQFLLIGPVWVFNFLFKK